jgi:hypothetical protein
MKKILSIVLALIMMLAVLSACADGNKTPATTTPEVSTTPDGGDDKPATDIAGWMSYSFEKVVATNPVPEESKRNTEITLYMTKNEKESATLSVYTKNRISGAKLVITEKPDDITVDLYKQHTQKVDKKEYPDGISIVSDSMLLKKNSVQSYLATVGTTKDTATGDKTIKIEFRDNKDNILVEYVIKVHVWNITLSDDFKYETATDLEEDMIAKFEGVKYGSEDPEEIAAFEAMYVAYYEKLLDYRMSAYNLPYDILDPRADAYMSDPRVTTFQVPTNVDDATLVAYYNKVKSNPVWFEKAYAYPKDEPNDKSMYDDVIEAANRIKALCPDLRLVVPFFRNFPYDDTRDAIDIQAEYLDILCAKSKCFYDRTFADKIAAKKDQGETIWCYVCWEPGYPYTNLYVDEKGINHRIQFWQQWNVESEGFLYWSSNYWGGISNPWTSMATVPNLSPDVFGDGSLLYTGIGDEQVCGSLRLDIVRDGIEDVELLYMAEELLGREAVYAISSKVAKDMVNYTNNTKTFIETRNAIAEALEAALSAQ